MNEKLCIKCGEPLKTSVSFPLTMSSSDMWCDNKNCDRRGLLTVIFLEAKEEKPKEASKGEVNSENIGDVFEAILGSDEEGENKS